MQIELYEFATQATTYRYTSSSADVAAWGATYTAVPISRGPVEGSDDLNRAGMAIATIYDLPYVAATVASGDYGTVVVSARNGATDSWDTIWRGRVTSISLAGAEAQISTESILTAERRLGMPGKFQLMCRHALYGVACGVDRESYKFTGAVSLISGYAITVPGVTAEADGYYNYGVADFGARGQALITGHAGDVLTLFNTVSGLTVGDAADVYAGCDRLLATCLGTFSNAANFGGFPWLPLARVKGSVPTLGHRRWR